MIAAASLAIGGIEIEAADVRSDTAIREITATGVEIDDLGQGRLTAVVEIRSGEFHVS